MRSGGASAGAVKGVSLGGLPLAFAFNGKRLLQATEQHIRAGTKHACFPPPSTAVLIPPSRSDPLKRDPGTGSRPASTPPPERRGDGRPPIG